jgi:signal transduction histidine kinase
MGNILAEISSLITTAPGNLTYYLVVAFSIVGSCALLIYRQNQSPSVESRRAFIALAVIIALWVGLFILAGLSWQGLIDERLVMPPLDRGVTLLSVLLIAWMWVFPRPARFADAATGLLAVLVVAFYVFTMVWWAGQGGASYYDGTWADLVAQYASIAMLAVACVLLFLGKPNSYGIGFGMLLLLLAGVVIYLLQLPLASDYAGAIRLAQMAAYPLLFALPLRFPQVAVERKNALQPAAPQRRIHGIDPALVEQFLALGTETDPNKISQAITRTVANAVPAEVCLLISSIDDRDSLTVYGGYDVVRERYLEGTSMRCQNIPAVAAAMQEGLPQSLSPDDSFADLASLSKTLNLGQVGYLLCAPILSEQGETLAGLILLSPYTRKGFSAEEQATLASFTHPLAQLLQRIRMLAEAESESAQLAALAYRELEVETSGQVALAQAGIAASAAFYDYGPGENPAENEAGYMEAELRLALEEVARLKGSLSDADQQLLALQKQMDTTHLSADQNEALLATIQELRQTMSAVVGYTDFLLNESVGILGTLQRRFLERVKISTERMNRLVEDLGQITSVKEGRRLIQFTPVDFNEIVSDAIANTEDQRAEKNITLHLDIPVAAPQIHTDRVALQQVLTHLLDNAGDITPADDEVTLRAILQSDDFERKFFLIQVSDSGGGIAVGDIPRVFSRRVRGQTQPIPGVSASHNNLFIVKRLVDALEGRIWVDSEPDLGSTFSILLPVSPEAPLDDGSGGPPA